MVQTVFAQKKDMRQVWTADGRRLVVTRLFVGENLITESHQNEDGTVSANIGFGNKKLKNMNRPQEVQLSKIGSTVGKRIFKQVPSLEMVEVGSTLRAEDVFTAGDVIKVSGTSKGKGYTGVVKRWGFSGGPRTHGQSDRTRAPGSIGAGTTPGRVWKNKKMAGRSGNATVTLENMVIVAVNPVEQSVWISGTLPGSFNSILTLQKQGTQRTVELNQSSTSLLDMPVVTAAPEAEPEVAVTENTESVAAAQDEAQEGQA
jgi:large subunit ribosomal protein L3